MSILAPSIGCSQNGTKRGSVGISPRKLDQDDQDEPIPLASQDGQFKTTIPASAIVR